MEQQYKNPITLEKVQKNMWKENEVYWLTITFHDEWDHNRYERENKNRILALHDNKPDGLWRYLREGDKFYFRYIGDKKRTNVISDICSDEFWRIICARKVSFDPNMAIVNEIVIGIENLVGIEGGTTANLSLVTDKDKVKVSIKNLFGDREIDFAISKNEFALCADKDEFFIHLKNWLMKQHQI